MTAAPTPQQALAEIKCICAAPFTGDREPGRTAIARLAIIERFAAITLGLDVPEIRNEGPTGNWPKAEA